MEVAAILAERQQLEERLRVSGEENSRTVRSLQVRLATAHSDLDLARSEMAALSGEYEGYKVGQCDLCLCIVRM